MDKDGTGRAAPWQWLLLALPPLLWAGNFIAGRAVRGDVPPLTLAFARHLIAFLALLPFTWRIVTAELPLYRAHAWRIARTALAGMAGFNLLVYAGLQSTSATNVLLLNSAIPVLIVLAGALLEREAIGARQGLGMLLSCLGVLVIIGHGEPARVLRLQFSHGDLLAFVAMGGFALYSLWLRALPAGASRLGILTAQLFVASIGALPFAAWEWAHGLLPDLSLLGIGATLYVALAASLLATLLYMAGVARVGAARAGLFLHLIPIYGALLSALLLGESLHGYHGAGIAAIVGGLLVANRAGARKVPEAAAPMKA